MNKRHIIFHSRDFDGIASAAVAIEALGLGTELHPWDYGQKEPEIPEGDVVYIIDVSLDLVTSEKHEVIWIDHHISAINKYPQTVEGIRVDGIAACRLAWLWFNAPNGLDHLKGIENEELKKIVLSELDAQREPRALQLVGEYDVWDLSKEALDLQYGLQVRKYLGWTTQILLRWLNLFQDPYVLKDVLKDGEIARAYYDNQAKITCEAKSYELEFEGHKFLAMNSNDTSSRAFNTPKIDLYDGLLKWNMNKDGRISVSLYRPQADDKFDFSVIAKKYGGGGHRGACGFTLPLSDLAMLVPSE